MYDEWFLQTNISKLEEQMNKSEDTRRHVQFFTRTAASEWEQNNIYSPFPLNFIIKEWKTKDKIKAENNEAATTGFNSFIVIKGNV